MSSTRFPGKVIAPLGESTVMKVLLSRLSMSKSIQEIIVATSLDPSDDALVDHIRDQKIFRGDLLDVRSRFIELGKKYAPQNIVRITGDCPLVCHELVDEMMIVHETERSDYTANCNLNPYPKGFDIEIFRTDILLRTDFLTDNLYDKEHVTPWMYSSGKLRVTNLEFLQHNKSKSLNFSVDTQKDLYFLNQLEIEKSLSKHTFKEIWRRIQTEI
jgi:spore coat polysaccharide biosynthesis protein SpsF (cytidylyltransferase family)